MLAFKNPFAPSASKPGHGSIVVALLPPATPVLQTLSYQYPLKLIAPDPITLHETNDSDTTFLVHTIFLLTYGGGLVAGDTITLHITLDAYARLILLTQGSTKIFKTPRRDLISGQWTTVDINDGAALCYLPDPVQPFGESAFDQAQTYNLESLTGGSMCICDWFNEGRTARGERWSFYRYTSKNEVWLVPKNGGKKRLLLRDHVILDEDGGKFGNNLAERVDSLGVYGSLIIRGPLFEALGKYFLDEFHNLPRIGGRKWDDDTEDVNASPEEVARLERQKQETKDGLIWTAASIRGFVLVKFGAKEVEGARRWLHTMIKSQGDVVKSFGEGALLCIR